VIDIIDKGAFGSVVKAHDMKERGREVAIKLSRNKKFDVENSSVEIRILKKIN